MQFATNEVQAEEVRDLLLKLVFLDQWRFYRPWFTVKKLKEGARRCHRPSQLFDWILREGSTFNN